MARTKIRKTYNLLIQVSLLILTYYFIYYKVFRDAGIREVFRSVGENWSAPEYANLMILTGILMFLNWGIEAYKWKYMIGKIERIGFFKSFYAVLTGISVSSFTPNRIGEYFGRVFVLDRASRVEGVLITVLGSMSQLLVTILTGSAALLVFIPHWTIPHAFLHGYLVYFVVFTVVVLNLIITGLYLNVSFLSKLRDRILKKRWNKVRKFLRVFALYRRGELVYILGLSFLRYLVFATQFFLLLKLFSVPVTYPEALMIISLIYLVMAIIPTILITELGIRGSVALYFFSAWFGAGNAIIGTVNFGVFAASTLVWVINVGIPALIGSFFLFRLHFFRKTTNPAG